jgi:nucleoside-diphosphate-sugar epimerase
LDTTKAKEVIGYKPTISFEDGIQETVDWIGENM